MDVEYPDIDDRYHSEQDLQTHSLGLLSVPLLSPITNTPIGVLQVSNRKRTDVITNDRKRSER